ncbi:uncharacterized protein LOC125073551 [Vanessa atalanta]|uniref:uncharacterized protein LOC125073551 n=1 Tax=Vanessa atalanta TaxID=42275 RepID=UPI001FCCCA69|nr:uncharacterized protein LOC125073551 [Vanessa atalanta]
MSRNLLTILVICSIFGISVSQNLNTILDIEKLLHSIHAQGTLENRDLEFGQLNHNRPSHHRHGHKTNNPNLMNIQTMNLYVKPRTQRYNLDNILRTETDRICKKTGRCGCTGTRCGDMNREDEVANEVDEIVNELNEQLERKEFKPNERDNDDSYDIELDKRLRCVGDRCGYGRYSVDYDGRPDNNDIDIVIFNKQRPSNEESEFVDLTRNSLFVDLDEATNKQGSYILELNQNAKATDLQSSESDPTPDEFVSHYQTVKNDVIEQLRHYIQNNAPIPLKHLHEKQKQLLRTLKMKYKKGRVAEDKLPSEIVRIVFGDQSETKIYPHIENNDNIYIPRWHYNSLLQFRRDLRSQKRILPLTTQQRDRLLNKQTKTIPKLAWRKSLNQKIKRFGVPFNLEIHGLGQMNS